MSKNLNKIFNTPQLPDVLASLKRQILLDFNCCHLATIQSFDGSAKTCTATINYKKTFMQRKDDGKYEPVLIDYPILVDVPVWNPRGGAAYLNMPIVKGDQALILFNDRDIDNWFAGKLNGDVATPRLHSISDGIALVGLLNASTPDEEYDATRAALGNGSTRVAVSATKVLIENETTTLNNLLGTLIDTINAITTTNCVVGAPVALSPASIAALNSVKTQIAGLLE